MRRRNARSSSESGSRGGKVPDVQPEETIRKWAPVGKWVARWPESENEAALALVALAADADPVPDGEEILAILDQLLDGRTPSEAFAEVSE